MWETARFLPAANISFFFPSFPVGTHCYFDCIPFCLIASEVHYFPYASLWLSFMSVNSFRLYLFIFPWKSLLCILTCRYFKFITQPNPSGFLFVFLSFLLLQCICRAESYSPYRRVSSSRMHRPPRAARCMREGALTRLCCVAHSVHAWLAALWPCKAQSQSLWTLTVMLPKKWAQKCSPKGLLF